MPGFSFCSPPEGHPGVREPDRRHAGLQHLRSRVGDEGQFALQHVDELVLVAVPVALRGQGTRRQAHQVHAEVVEAEGIAQRALLALAALALPGLGIGRPFSRLNTHRIEGGKLGGLGHAVSS